MEKLITIAVATFVYSWIYGEKLYYFLMKGDFDYDLRTVCKR